jgi:hypothetical protein
MSNEKGKPRRSKRPAGEKTGSGQKDGGRKLLALGSVTVDLTDEEVKALADEMAELIMAGLEEPDQGQPALPQPTDRPARRKGRRPRGTEGRSP